MTVWPYCLPFFRHIIAAKLCLCVFFGESMCHNLLHKTGSIIVIKTIKEISLIP